MASSVIGAQSGYGGQIVGLPARFGQNVEQLWPTDGAVPGSCNFDASQPGKLIPAFDHVFMVNSSDMLQYPVGPIETQNPNGSPRQYCGGNKTMHYLEDGAKTQDIFFSDVVQGMAIGDSGTASQQIAGGAPFFTAGTKALIVGFGSSPTVACAIRQLTIDGAPAWTVHTDATTFAQFWSIVKSGRDLYAVTKNGTTVIGEYNISKCPAGNDPTLISGWGGATPVGTPEWQVNSIAPIGDGIVCGKPDGLWQYDDQTKRFRNMMPWLQDAPHALNGKGMRAVVNGVLYPTFDGKLFHFDGVTVTEVTPWKGQYTDRDVKQGRISAIADCGEYVAVAVDAGQNTTQGLGLQVIKYQAGTATDVTALCTDGKLGTGFSMLGWGQNVNDALFVLADRPFEEVVFRVTRQANGAVQSLLLSVQGANTGGYTNGTTGTVLPFNNSFHTAPSTIDGTILSTAGIGLALTGYPPSASNGMIMGGNINNYDVMTVTQLQFGGSIGTVNKMGYKFVPSTASVGMAPVGTNTDVQCDEVELVPSRAGMPNGLTGSAAILTTSTNFTHRDRSGCETHIYLGKREHTTGYIWFDAYALEMYGGVTALGWHGGRPGVRGNGGQLLAVWGRFRQALILDGTTRTPARTYVPRLRQFDTAGPGPYYPFPPTALGDKLRVKKMRIIRVDGEYIEPGDRIDIWGQWDQNYDIFLVGTAVGAPADFNVANDHNTGQGRILRLYMGFNRASNTVPVAAPVITGVWVAYDYVDDDYEPRDIAVTATGGETT